MSKIKVDYLGDLRTTSLHVDSKTRIETDAPKDNSGLGRKFSPTDLIASSLGSCLLTIMAMVAKRHGIDLGNTYANIEKNMSKIPRKISAINVDIFFDEKIDIKNKDLLIRASKHCPVHNSLDKEIDININFN